MSAAPPVVEASAMRAVASPDELRQAVADSKFLLAYATGSGRSIDQKTIATIVATERKLRDGTLGVDEEIAFWIAHRDLAAALAPTTIASLRATAEMNDEGTGNRFVLFRRNLSPAPRAVRYYTTWVIAILAVLLVVQIYQLFGASVTRELDSIKTESAALSVRYQAAMAKGSQLDSDELAEINTAQGNLDLRQKSSYDLLKWWSDRLPDWVAPVPTSSDTKAPDTRQANNLSVLQRATMVNEALQRYVLPLLYGLLGSCVWVLRTLAVQIRARSFTESQKIDFRLRIYTGMLSGLVVGWFFTSGTSGAIASLSPNALAFLAGYAIDLLFSAMDKLLSAFSTTSTPADGAK